MQLVICEKQLAAKRIADILSKGSYHEARAGKVLYYDCGKQFVIGLSGHVLNVDFGDEYKSWSKVKLPSLVKAEINYVPIKKSIINAVKKLAREASEVIVSTDFDTEGESIGLEAYNIVQSVKDLPVKRARFSTITQDEIIKAFSNLSELDFNLAYSANARREIDLIWGAVLTRFISLASHRLGNYYLSVGRVQSPTLKLIVDREKERLAFKPEPYWETPLILKKDGVVFEAHYVDKQLFDKSFVDKLLSLNPEKAIVKEVSLKKRSVKPLLPINTTSLLRMAASAGFSSMNAMRVAESLYLKGLISYPRTNNQVYPDSINLSLILEKLKSYKHEDVIKELLKKPIKPSKGKLSKDHPPIHPTGELPKDLSSQEKKLYDLILNRFIATLMPPSLEELTRVVFDVSSYEFISNGLRILEPGFKALYDNTTETILPSLSKGDEVLVLELKSVSKMTEPPRRYGHGTLIKLMSDLNLGTKATRPGIIQKLIDRYYISRKTLAPSPIAFAVINALSKHAHQVVDVKMTSDLEDNMKLIAESGISKDEVVNKSRELLLDVLSEMLSKEQEIADSIREGIRQSKIVGSCPECGSDLIIRVSRSSHKRFIGCAGYPKCCNSWPLPQSGTIQVLHNKCSHCGINQIILIRKGKRPFTFCPNLDCLSKKGKES